MNTIRDPNWMTHLWQRVKNLFSGLDARVTALEQGGGGGGGGAVSGVKGDAESTYRTGNVNLTPANIGAKAVQAAVSDPTASGTSVTFIDSISQDAQGVITPTKKTVSSASQSADGLMSSTDKTKLDGIASGAQVNTITGVKGSAEGSYRTGDVNLTPANIGALAAANVYNGLDQTAAGYALDARAATVIGNGARNVGSIPANSSKNLTTSLSTQAILVLSGPSIDLFGLYMIRLGVDTPNTVTITQGNDISFTVGTGKITIGNTRSSGTLQVAVIPLSRDSSYFSLT